MGRTTCIENGECVTCGCDAHFPDGFRDQLSKKEYAISGMCQKCQDSVFDSPEE